MKGVKLSVFKLTNSTTSVSEFMCRKAYDRETACHSVDVAEYHDSRKDVLSKGVVDVGDKWRDGEHSDAVEEVKHSVCKVEPGQAKQFESAQR